MGKPKKLPPVHPGKILLEDFIKPLGLSMNKVALDLRVAEDELAERVDSGSQQRALIDTDWPRDMLPAWRAGKLPALSKQLQMRISLWVKRNSSTPCGIFFCRETSCCRSSSASSSTPRQSLWTTRGAHTSTECSTGCKMDGICWQSSRSRLTGHLSQACIRQGGASGVRIGT